MTRPIIFRWSNGTMIPKHQAIADREYEPDRDYVLVEQEHRSKKSHDHYFACVEDAWENLPEHLAEQFPPPDALRKRALIRAGYRDERTIACSSKAEARRVAAFIKPMDEYALVVVSEALVSVYTAQSQKMKAMGRARFQQSKTDVLGLLATLLGVEPEQFGKAA